MRVLFDHQIFAEQRWGGISRYFAELVSGISGRVEVDLALARSRNEEVPALERIFGIRVTDRGFPETFLGGKAFPGRKQLRSIVKRLDRSHDARKANLRAALGKLRAGRFDLFHPTYYDPYFLDALAGRPFVLTVFDLTHEVLPAHFSPRDTVSAWKREVARAATRLVAISEHTKADLVRILGVAPDVVDVVHLGFTAPDSPAPAPDGLPERYVLFTGRRFSYKNWAFCVRALAPLLRAARDLHLVCSGEPLSREEQELVASEGITAKVRRVPAGQGVLQTLYARAAAFVFPSLYEGFGIPVLEAFAAGCPAALATGSSLPEVGGDAALYFDPGDEGALRAAVDRLLTDAALRAELVERGRRRVAEFTWERTCDQTLETYRRALGPREGARRPASRRRPAP